MLDDRPRLLTVAVSFVMAVLVGVGFGVAARVLQTTESDEPASSVDQLVSAGSTSTLVTTTSQAPTTRTPSTTASPVVETTTTVQTTTTIETTTSIETTSTSAPTSAPTTTEPPTTVPATQATLPDAAPELARPDDVVTAGFEGAFVVIEGRVERTDRVVVWADDAHPATAVVASSPAEVWAVTSSGALLGGTAEGLAMASPASGLGYQAIALTAQNVVAATTSGAVVAFDRDSPAQSRVIASPVGLDGVALPVTTMEATGGEGLRVAAGDRIFLLDASSEGVAIDCGPADAPSC